MIGSYLAMGFRRLVSQKLYSTLNIVGLAVGLACAILILLYVRYELSFDRGFPDSDRIYRISAERGGNGVKPFHPAKNVYPAGPLLALDFKAEIEQTARIAADTVRLKHGADTYYESGFRYADGSFFDIFAFEWLAGDPQTALAEPSTLVLTESTAKKYFGSASPIGETLLLEGQWPLRVTGVIRDLPRNTHLSATAIASFDVGEKVLGWNYDGNWNFWHFHTYARLRPGVSIDSLSSRFADFVARHNPGGRTGTMSAARLSDIHLHGREGELTPPGNVADVAAFAALAFCILLIACVNFMNLSTARAAQRAREIGVRKVIGAFRGQLIAQFLGEAVLYAALAALIAVALVEVLLPPFNRFAGTAIAFGYGDAGTLAA
ncbi:MAG TPA: ABC transporter permease, partial [Gammaproteobacteria bacterium]|nr:ABC transporter permease [Gammaproteobacteria bacterium]